MCCTKKRISVASWNPRLGICGQVKAQLLLFFVGPWTISLNIQRALNIWSIYNDSSRSHLERTGYTNMTFDLSSQHLETIPPLKFDESKRNITIFEAGDTFWEPPFWGMSSFASVKHIWNLDTAFFLDPFCGIRPWARADLDIWTTAFCVWFFRVGCVVGVKKLPHISLRIQTPP